MNIILVLRIFLLFFILHGSTFFSITEATYFGFNDALMD